MQQMTAAVGEGSETMQGSASERENIFCSAAKLTLVCGKMFEVNAHSERRFRKLHFAKVNAHSSGEFHATLCRNGH